MSSALPPDAAAHVAAIFQSQDPQKLSQLSVKAVRGLLEERLKLEPKAFQNHREKIKELMDAELARRARSDQAESPREEPETEEGLREAPAEVPPGLDQLVQTACREAVRTGLQEGLGAIRQIVREELDRDGEEEESSDEEEDDDEESGEEGLKLIICVRNDLSMSVGKVAAQVGHAVHYAVKKSRWCDLRAWESIGCKKVTLRVDGEEQLRELEKTAKKRGLLTQSIQDAGHTEVEPGTTTVLAIGPARNSEVDAVTGHLKPLPDKIKQLERDNTKLKERAERLQKELDASKRKQKQILQQMRSTSQYL